jgi:hypothetical protein
MPDLHIRLQLVPQELTIGCLPSLPYWWRPTLDDIALLRGLDKWGSQYSEMAKDLSLDTFKNIPTEESSAAMASTMTLVQLSSQTPPIVTSLSFVPTESPNVPSQTIAAATTPVVISTLLTGGNGLVLPYRLHHQSSCPLKLQA